MTKEPIVSCVRRFILCLFVMLMPVWAPAIPGAAGLGRADAAPASQSRIDWTSQPVRLLMVERDHCIYCRAWHAQIGPGYAASPAGQAAPLLTLDMDGPWPDGLVLARRPFVTPTFILLNGGVEVARVEGYALPERFYPAIHDMLATTAIKAATKKGYGQ